jgi:hypothetical protein
VPISIDPITFKRLILVKQLYQHAVVQASSQIIVIGRIMAVIGFDLTVETALKAVVSSLDSSKTPSDAFQSLVQQADDLLSKSGYNPVPDRANILHVHSVRNDAQHKAKYPNESDVSDCRTYARDFLQKIVADVWGFQFEKISLTDVVQHDRVKAFLVEAEKALEQGNYQDAVEQGAAGLTLSLNFVRRSILGRSGISPEFVLERGSIFDQRDVSKAFMNMQEIFVYLALGMNYTEYVNYRQIAGKLDIYDDGTIIQHYGMKEKIDINDAEFVVAYCTDNVVQIENRVGNLEKPFGKALW